MLYLFLKYPAKYLLQEVHIMLQCFLNEILWNKNVYKYDHPSLYCQFNITCSDPIDKWFEYDKLYNHLKYITEELQL